MLSLPETYKKGKSVFVMSGFSVSVYVVSYIYPINQSEGFIPPPAYLLYQTNRHLAICILPGIYFVTLTHERVTKKMSPQFP